MGPILSLLLAGTAGAAWLSPTALAQNSNNAGFIYDTIHQNVLQESGDFDIEPDVQAYVVAILQADGVTVTPEQVKQSLIEPPSVVCYNKDDTKPETDRTECLDRISRIQDLIAREERVRSVGRDLQVIASSAELSTESYPGMGTDAATLKQAIRTIWGATKAGTSSLLTIRTWPTDGQIQGDINKIAGLVQSMPTAEQTGAIWRELYGSRFVRGQLGRLNPNDSISNPDNAAGTERYYLWLEHPLLDQALDSLRTDLLAIDGPADGPILYPEKSMGSNLIVWVTDVDAGLREKIPTEPVLPAIMSDGQTVKGGRWPPPPPGPQKAPGERSDEDDSSGLCLDPIAKDGQLCTPVPEAEFVCDKTESAASDAVVLADCTASSESSQDSSSDSSETSSAPSPAGPQICSDLDWRNGGFDPDHQCTPELECEDVCADTSGQLNPDTEFHVYQKENKNGKEAVARGCVKNSSKLLPAYQLIRAASGLRLTCESTNGVSPDNNFTTEEKGLNCCDEVEQFSTTMCRAMEDDGVFTGEDGQRLVSSGGEPFTVGSCALGFAIDYCGPQCGGPMPDGFIDELTAQANTNPAGLPTTCEGALSSEERVGSLLEEAGQIDEPCSPDRIVDMDNTIASNACYAGECIEYTLKTHDVTPKDGTLTALDPANPFAPSLGLEFGPQKPNFLLPPPPARLPTYNPGRIVGDFDRAFCQINGLPPLTPPVICAMDPLRRLTLPIIDPYAQLTNLGQQQLELNEDQQSFLRVGLTAGIRIGDDIFITMFRAPIAALTDSINVTTTLFKALSLSTFPMEMCPSTPDQALTSSSESSADSSAS